MTQTPNFQLNQWSPEDYVRRTDFNADNAKIDAALNQKGNCRIVTGSYTGTGEYGINHKNSISFDFLPKMVIIAKKTSSYAGAYFLALSGQSKFCPLNSSGGGMDNICTWADNTLTWYSTQSADVQANETNTDYLYLAIG